MNLEVDNLSQEIQSSVVEVDDYDCAKHAPKSVIVSSVEEVRRRVALAEERIRQTGGIKEEEFWEAVENHLDTL